MPKPYQPTGRPPGRPRKPEVERQAIRDVPARLRDTTQDRRYMPMVAICPDCFPDGWDGCLSTAANCPHGTWVRRVF